MADRRPQPICERKALVCDDRRPPGGAGRNESGGSEGRAADTGPFARSHLCLLRSGERRPLQSAEEADAQRQPFLLVALLSEPGLDFAGGELVLTEGGPKKRAGVWLLTPEAVEAELEHLGPDALGIGEQRLGEILAEQPRRLHSLLRDQRVIAGIGRAWANEILHTAQLSPFAPAQGLSPEQVTKLASAIDSELERGLELRERGAKDAKVYRVHNKLHEPCFVCGAPIERVDFDEHTIFYCPQCQTGGRLLKDRRLSRLLR